MTTVAVLGTGTMGAGMARCLLRDEHDVRVWNRTRERAEPLAADGATVAGDPAEAVRGAEVVLVILYDADSVTEVLEQAAPGIDPDAVVVQASTVGLDIERVAEAAHRLGLRLLDAPVLGTKKPAEDGTLTVLASGDPTLRRTADPVLHAIGARTLWVGDEVGLASRLKLVANAWVGTVTAGLAQSVALAEGLGLDPQLFLDAIEGSAVAVPYAGVKVPQMIRDDHPTSFAVDGVSKDLALISAAAEQADVADDLLAALRALFARTSEAGRGAEDMSAVRSAY
jgi:3-hydroxyisobutyrate dehydrogenase